MATNPTPTPTDRHERFRNLLIGNLFIFTATLFWSLNIPADKVMVPQWISGAQLGVVRIVGATVLVWLTSLLVRCDKIDRADWGRLAAAGVALFGFLVVFSMSFRYTSPVDISIILTFPPLMVIGLRALWLHERPSRLELVGIAVAFLGAVFLIFMSSRDAKEGAGHLVGDLLAFASCACYAVYLVIIEKPARKYKPINLTRWVQLVSSACCIPFLFFTFKEPVFQHPDTTSVVLLALIVLLPSYAAYLFVPPSIKRIGSDLEAMYQYLIPIIATIASIAIGIAEFHWFQPVALAVIFVGVYLANRAKFRALAAPKA